RNGDISSLNGRTMSNPERMRDVRLAGFTGSSECAPSQFCLVFNGATGGNNAWAILALVAAVEELDDVRYLDDATLIGNWIVGNLTDKTGYGGYFLGYPDERIYPKPLLKAKSVEHNADIFAAFTALAAVNSQIGNPTAS